MGNKTESLAKHLGAGLMVMEYWGDFGDISIHMEDLECNGVIVETDTRITKDDHNIFYSNDPHVVRAIGSALLFAADKLEEYIGKIEE